MAAEVVGGAFLSSFLNVLFDRLSKPEVVNWIRGKKLDQKLLQRLETTLCVVQAVLNDAEQKQITDPAVKRWLVNLEDAFYKADDLLDEVSTKAATQKDPGNFLSRCLNLHDREREMVTKIEEVIGTLEEIAKHKDILRLEKIAGKNISWGIPTTHLVVKSDIYGRDKDRDAIVKLLLDDTNDREISVIPIVGMGGIGKTTLAQLVYNDEKVQQKFGNFKAWICIGEEFDVLKMTKTVIENAKCRPCDKNNLDSVQDHLKNELIGKKFLVVLDDMWSNNYGYWRSFLKPFECGSEGGKILVTTRDDAIASMVKTTIPAHKLSFLDDGSCWLVFAKHAFFSTELRDRAALEKVGRKIVEKCKGLPLAARTLGGLLRSKENERDWNEVLESEIWDFSEEESSILPALRISYHYLPSYLKRCFVYCSLYPKDCKFDRDELVLLWMAEDLLQRPNSGRTVEETGYKYFNDLASRSFFQHSNTDENSFVMHDLMHDLATFYGGKFFFRTSELNNAAKPDIKTRHLSYDLDDKDSVSKILEASDSLKHARTLLLQIRLDGKKTALCDLLARLKCLRVLSLRSFHLYSLPDSIGELKHLLYLDLSDKAIVSLPDSIGELIHLRYLDLSDKDIVSLPESLHNLYNLQTLKLRYCERLKMLPSGMQDLVNLRHLDIRGTHLKEMPKGMSKLKELQFLSNYIVGEHEENGIRELGALASLHGALSISKLENVDNSGEASEARMSDKKHINVLKLKWSSDGDGGVDSQTEREILDKLRPNTDLKELTIEGYRGTKFPDWLGRSSYHHMTELELTGCNNCCMLPSLGQLPSLKSLWLYNFDKLTTIGAEFYKNDETHQEVPFKSLKTLVFDYMPCWQEWQSFESDPFPQLEELSIWECPKLRGGLPCFLPSLKELAIYGCDQLACSLPRAPAIQQLEIGAKQEVRMQEQSLSLLRTLSISGTQLVASVLEAMTYAQPNCLRYLYISDCASAISFPGDCLPASLEDLRIKDCHNLEFPMQQQLQQHESLQELEIDNSCDSLTSFPLAAFPNLRSLHITRCENMKSVEGSQSQSHDAAPLSLDRLSISECPSFVSLLSQSRNDALPSLSRLSIGSCPCFISLSALGLAAPQLQYLEIQFCPQIESLTDGDEDCLPASLQELFIIDCHNLEFPMQQQQQQQHESLKSLIIKNSCDSLTSFPLAAFPNLRSLHITRCENMNSLGVSQSQSHDAAPLSLWSLDISECPSFVSLLSQSRNDALPSLSRLCIGSCPSFISLSALGLAAPWLELLDISSCPEIDSLADGDEGLPPKLRTLSIVKCDKLVRWLASSTVLHSPGLISLMIGGGGCESVESFPREGCLPASLKSLYLYGFPSLETLDCNGLLHLTSLRELDVKNCPKLEKMAGERLPASLMQLLVDNCPLLGERIRTKDPQIWPTISHIPEIQVDREQIA